MPPLVIDTINDFRANLLRNEQAQMAEAARRWLGVEQALQVQADALSQWMAGDGHITRVEHLMQSRRWQELQRQVDAELGRYAGFLNGRIVDGQRQMALNALSHSQAVINVVAVDSEIVVQFNRLPISAVENMIGLAGDGSPVRTLLDEAAAAGPDAMAQELVNGIALGRNPLDVARRAIRQGLGQTFTRMATIARTEQLRVYRETTLQSYRASNVVVGYKRLSARDERTCFVAGTMVSTPSGERPIESIRVGDTVLTHMGPRRVTATMARPYTGDLTAYTMDGTTTICTPEHPVWVGRSGEYKWLPAGALCAGDELVLSEQVNQHLAGNGGNSSGAFPSQMDRAISLPGKKGIAPTFFGGVLVPVPPIGFKGDIVGQDKVDSIPSRWNLFLVRDAEFQKSIFAGYFKRGISGVRSVAMGRAEVVSVHNGCRNTTKLFPAMGASDYARRASAFLGTVLPVGVPGGAEYLTASIAGDVLRFFGSAFHRASGIPFLVGRSYGEVVPADGACFGNGEAGGIVAFAGTIQVINRCRLIELLSAPRTGVRFPVALENSSAFLATAQAFWTRIGVVFQVGRWLLERLSANRASQVDSLIAPNTYGFRQAFGRTISVFAPLDGGRMAFNGGATDRTFDSYHAPIISQVRRQLQAETTVYNLEVDDAHTYFANGALVHNCVACLFADGRYYELGESFDQHPNCRCTLLPVLRNVPPTQYETGQQWFRRQPDSTQRSMMGRGRYEAWRAGAVSLDDLVSRDWDDVWGGSLRPTRVSDL